MSGQVFHFPPDFLNLLIDTIPRLCRSKKDVLIFFSSAGVHQGFLADLSEKLQKDASNINKYEITRTVLVRINDAGDIALRERREIVKRVTELNDFSRCWPNDQLEAMGLVAKVREFVKKIIVLFTLKELALLLEGENSFESLLKSKVEAIQLEGKLVYDL